MSLQDVHEQADLNIRVGSSQTSKVLLEHGLVHRLVENLIMFKTILLEIPASSARVVSFRLA